MHSVLNDPPKMVHRSTTSGDIVIPVYLGGTMLDEVIVNAQQKSKITVAYFNPQTAEAESTEMYIDGFKVKLEGDTSYKGLWSVSFSLKEF